MRKGILGKVIALIMLVPAVASAQVITEVFYSPQSKSWIEVYNNTSSNLDLTKYKVLDAGAAVNGHGITFISGSSLLSPGNFAVIAKDPTQLPGLSASMFKSALAAKTSGDTISLKDASGNIVDTFSFSPSLGATGDGNSLQKFDTGWAAALPTPSAINLAPVVIATSSDATSTATTTDPDMPPAVTPIFSSHYSFVPVSDSPSQKLTASAGRNRLGFVGVPLAFKAITDTNDANVSYFWSFGDGAKEEGKEIMHTYLYPGTYIVVLNVKLFEYEAVGRATVKIVVPEVSINSASPDAVEIKNSSQYEMNLYGFRLRMGLKTFEFPKDTIINANSSVILPKVVTKLDPRDKSLVKLETTSTPVMEDKVAVTETPIQAATSSIENINEPVVHAEEIQALGDQLVSLTNELNELTGTPTEVAVIEEQKVSDTEIPQTAAVIQSLPSIATSSWMTTLKHFFFR